MVKRKRLKPAMVKPYSTLQFNLTEIGAPAKTALYISGFRRGFVCFYINKLVSEVSAEPRKVATPPISTPSISSSGRIPMTSMDI